MIISGSKWYDINHSLYVVDEVSEYNNDIWVYYSKVDKYGFSSDMKYSCLIGAFKLKFISVYLQHDSGYNGC